MNIPLNIDWQQILLHLLNFSVLTLGLYLLLYKPVRDFMEERVEHYRKQGNEAQEKLNQAEDLKISYRKRLDSIETEIEEKEHVLHRNQSKRLTRCCKVPRSRPQSCFRMRRWLRSRSVPKY